MVVCDGCNADCPRRDFSKGQLRKPYPRCYDCTQGTAGQKRALDYDVYECNECGRQFSDENALAQHRHTHRARSFPCPGCGQLYRGMTDAASHFESGGCSACRDKEQARRVAYERVAQTAGSSNFLVNPHSSRTTASPAVATRREAPTMFATRASVPSHCSQA